MSDPAPWPDYLFDIGNVILHFDYRRFARRIAGDCSCAEEDLLSRLKEDYQRFEGRALSTAQFLELAVAQTGYRGLREAFIRAWQEIFEPNQPVIDLIEGLAEQGHRLYLLSNTNELHASYFLREYPVFRHFRGGVFSHEAGCLKPDPEIYREVIRKLGLLPERTVYIDDMPANVEAGAAFGFLAIRYQGQDPSAFAPRALARGAAGA